ncbi:MAG: peptidoglycan-binding protein [Candidatus Omnitrophica bacterium]|nr:peptidoglycan-binding protein [Candidatus Omnitrophota bacterium]
MGNLVFSIIFLAFFFSGCTKNSERVETPIEPAQEMLNEATLEISAVAPATESSAMVADQASPLAMSLQDAIIPEKPTSADIQKALKNVGLYEGKIDGTIGAKSKKAIEEFQAKNDLTVDGKVGPKT